MELLFKSKIEDKFDRKERVERERGERRESSSTCKHRSTPVSWVPKLKCKGFVTSVLIGTSLFYFVFWYMIVFYTKSQDRSLEPSFSKLNFLHLCYIPSLWSFIQEAGFWWILCCKKNLTSQLLIQQCKNIYQMFATGQWIL